MTSAGPSPHRPGASIGTVLQQLRPEFPDVTISKIRFLESEGLIRPGRSASGYRQFAAADIERLRYILTAQRDYYLPLKVIKEQLDHSDHGGAARGGPRPLVGVRPEPAPTAGTEKPASGQQRRLTREELLERANITAAALSDLEAHGVLRPGPAGFYDTDAVALARTAAAMIELGLEARHLRAFRTAADREVDLLAQIVAPVRHKQDPDAQAKAEEAGRELAGLAMQLHELWVRVGLRKAIAD